jgi:hypothetical protein
VTVAATFGFGFDWLGFCTLAASLSVLLWATSVATAHAASFNVLVVIPEVALSFCHNLSLLLGYGCMFKHTNYRYGSL